MTKVMPEIDSRLELIGRGEEMGRLKELWQDSKDGKGSTVFISGEAGIGKTRLVEEILDIAEKDGAKTIRGVCLSDNLQPLMPFKEALREADLYHLISEDPPPKVLAAYLINDDGILVSKAERKDKDADIDSDIFSSMLKVVQDFVKDSLSMMGRDETGELNTIGYGDYNILIQSIEGISLATVVEGSKSEFLIDDMKEKLEGKAEDLEDWEGDMSKVEEIGSEMQWFLDSGKYDGEFLVDDPKIKQENLFDNVLLGLQRLSTDHPVVLFLDDLQWADPTSLKLLHYISRNTRDNKVLILGTYRPEDIVERYDREAHHLKKAMQKMNREGLYEEIELERLDKSDVEEFIEKTLGEIEREKEIVKKLYRESEGNPFFLLEFIQDLIEEGHLAKGDDGWKAEDSLKDIHITSRVYDLVVRRLDRLMEEQRELLECASVIGEKFESEILGKMTGLKRVKLLKNLNELEKTHKLIESLGDEYRFDHSKIREVLYNGLNEELQREYHRIVAEGYEERDEDEIDKVVEDIAYHLFQAEDERAIDYLLDAGDKAQDKYANEEAEWFYKHALSLVGEKETNTSKKAYEGLGDVYKRLGKYDDSIENYQNAMGIVEDDKEKGSLHGKIAGVLREKGGYEESLKPAEEGLSLVGEDDIERCNLFEQKGWALMGRGDYDKAITVFKKEKDLAESLDRKEKRAQALHDLGAVHWYEGDYDKAEENLQNAIETRENIENLEGLSNSYNNIAIIYQDKGELDRSLKYHERSLDIRRDMGDKHGIAASLNNLAVIYRRKGEMDRALKCHEQSLDIKKEIGNKNGIATSLGNMGVIYHDKGELDEALEYHERSLDIEKEIGDKDGISASLNNIGTIYENKGKLDRALEYYERSLDIKRRSVTKTASQNHLPTLGSSTDIKVS
uniref:TPR repeat-containing adenylate/guanylate cyclase n=1 Tax=uncultured organism TaxID=155900 RepID=M1QAP3_9ZZZZ|nr:TPR repeat-containing adenylate/guanylate cyclase [uncultured organism]